jgi:hypothetical protein
VRQLRQLALALGLGLIASAAAAAPEAEQTRSAQYRASSIEGATVWQQDLRQKLFERMHLRDLVTASDSIPLNDIVIDTIDFDTFRLQTIEIQSTPARRIRIRLATPAAPSETPFPAVVAIHGHGGTRDTPFNPGETIYKEFGTALARQGFVVVSTDVGQHEVYESGHTLMGERLWDLMRCVDYLASLPNVDRARIGCAGLSLGGEMAMWLGAMDTRTQATVSAGFLTVMDQMEQNHCMCWKFDGLRELVDFPDIYALIAPRALQCQNGRLEPETQFNVVLAERAMAEIRPAYADLQAVDQVELHIHEGEHEIDLDALLRFLITHLNALPPDPPGR